MRELEQNNRRLFPSRADSRFYIFTMIRNAILSIAASHFPKHQELILVDLGCGTMPYRPILMPYVKEYIGIDLSSNPSANLFINELDGTTPLPPGYADIVISTQVLEHVTEPSCYLRECTRILKPNGLLLLSTHGYWTYHPHPQDLWRWTSEGLRKVVEDAGFRIDAWQGVMGLTPTALQLLQDSVTPVVPKIVQRLFWFCMQILIGIMDKLGTDSSRSSESCVYVVVAYKP